MQITLFVCSSYDRTYVCKYVRMISFSLIALFSCDKPFVLQPYIEAEYPAAGQLDQEAAKAGQPGEVGAASGQPGKEAAKAGQADGGGETKPPTRPAHQRQKVNMD